jgi:hypothetical protein
MRPLVAIIAAALSTAAPPALAGPSISLNGVKIDGVTDQKFDNASVLIDGAGNVYITARGYAVKGEPAAPPVIRPGTPVANGNGTPGAAAPPGPPAGPPPASPPAAAPPAAAEVPTGPTGRLTRRYFLATEQSQPDGTQYDIEVFINSSWIRVIRSADPQVVAEVTRYLRPGANKVTLSATKKLGGAERRYFTTNVFLRVVIGEGNVGGDHVMIDTPLVVMNKTAADLDDATEEFTVEAR